MACQEGHTAIVNALFGAGADPNLARNVSEIIYNVLAIAITYYSWINTLSTVVYSYFFIIHSYVVLVTTPPDCSLL